MRPKTLRLRIGEMRNGSDTSVLTKENETRNVLNYLISSFKLLEFFFKCPLLRFHTFQVKFINPFPERFPLFIVPEAKHH
jgi:hypothetical protein